MGSAICGSATDTAPARPVGRQQREVPQEHTEAVGLGSTGVLKTADQVLSSCFTSFTFAGRKPEQPEVNYDDLLELWQVYNKIRKQRLNNELFISIVDGIVQHARRQRSQETTESKYVRINSTGQEIDPLLKQFILLGAGYEYQSPGKFFLHHTVCDHQLHGIITFLDQAKHNHAVPVFALQQVLAPVERSEDNTQSLDVDEMIRMMLTDAQLPPASSILKLLVAAKQMFHDEPNVVMVKPPCVLVGDIHGQFFDLRDRVLASGGLVEKTRYIFLGDYVDRGEFSLLCATLLIAFKVRYPQNVFLLRGNHESKMTNNIYGFQQECRMTFPELSQGILMDHPIWASFNDAFDLLPLMAIVGNRVLCMHGGLSPEFQTPAHVMTVDRGVEIEANQLMSDITWSDPTPSEGFYGNLRGLGHLFGPDVTNHVLRINHMTMLVRAHQCIKGGFQFDHGEFLVTLFSAPNYCNLGNKGAIMLLDVHLNMTFIVYDPAPKEVPKGLSATIVTPDTRHAPPYFWVPEQPE